MSEIYFRQFGVTNSLHFEVINKTADPINFCYLSMEEM